MTFKDIYRFLVLGAMAFFFGSGVVNAQFLLQAPNGGGESNYRWYEATDTSTVLSTNFFYETSTPGVYFATYDGTLCGSNATDYFILTDCNAPDNQVTLDITANVSGSTTVSWNPVVPGDQTQPVVTSTTTVVRYVATVTKAGNSFDLPGFTVVCLAQAANVFDDMVTVDEDSSVVVDIYANDNNLPTTGTLTTTNPPNGTVNINDSGTPNDPTDDIVTYIPDPDYNGPDSFDYTVCNSLGDCSTATVSVDVLPIVDAIDDNVATDRDVPVLIDVLANDNDIPTDGSMANTLPANGFLLWNDNGTPTNPSDDDFTYTPNPGYMGNDSFTYTICDAFANCSTATVNILVNPPGSDLDLDDDGIVNSFEDLNLDGDNDPATNPTDTDSDGIPDYLDIDSDNDGIPDNVEAQSTTGYIVPSGIDTNGNGLDDAYDNGGVGLIPVDTDGDSLPDYVDDDSDNDNVPDYIEGHDQDGDGVPDVVFIGSDKDNDGLDDGFEGSVAIDTDVNDEFDSPFDDLPNTDSDSESDYRDIDDDDDGVPTAEEDENGDGDYSNDDIDSDGIPDYLEPNFSGDDIEVFNVVTPNGDGIHDVLTISGLENFPNNTIRIYNRWGVQVFQTRAYDTQGNVFDGTSEGRVTVERDNKLPVGTYFYILDYENEFNEMKSISGYLYINR